MPLYDYKCKSCGDIHEELKHYKESKTTNCPKCGAVSIKLLTIRRRYRDFVTGWWEDIGKDPIYISSKRQLREECKKHDCYAVIDDGYLGV